MLLRLCLVLAVGWTLSSTRTVTALDRSDLSLYIPFEGSLNPTIRDATVSVSLGKGKKSDIAFAAGRRGRALVLKTGVNLNYVGRNMFASSEGTLSFWIRPIGWQGEDGKYHWFVNLFSPTTSHQFYKYGAGGQVIMYITGRGKGPTTLGQNHVWDKFAQGKWTHLAFTFKKGEQVYYIDGRPMQRRVDRKLLAEPDFNGKNATLHLHEGHPANAIDELMCFRRALSESEVRALFGAPDADAILSAPYIPSPRIDGKRSSPAEWKSATQFVGWRDEVLGLSHNNPTQVHVGQSGHTLLVRFVRPIPAKFRQQRDVYVGSPVKTTVKKRDGNLTVDDHVAVRLRSPEGIHYKFAINGNSTRSDSRNGQLSWNGTWQASQSFTDFEWIVEFALPLKQISPQGMNGNWGINFDDVHRQIEKIDAVWHHSRKIPAYGRLQFDSGGTDPVVQLTNYSDPGTGSAAIRGRIVSGKKAELLQRVGAGKGRLPRQTSRSPKSAQGLPRGKKELVAKGQRMLRYQRSASDAEFGEMFVRVGTPTRTIYQWHAPYVYSSQQSVAAHYLPTSRTLRAIVDAGSQAEMQRVEKIVLSVAPEKDKPVIKRALQPRSVRETIVIPCNKLPVGKYNLLAEFQLGQSIRVVKSEFEILPDPEWLHNRLGLTPIVPKPWIPVRTKNQTVSVLGRDYHLGAAGLPTGIVVNGEQILARPTQLAIRVNGQRYVATGRPSVKLIDAGTARVAHQWNAGQVQVAAATKIEFDGAAITKMTLVTNAQAAKLDSVTVEFVLKRQYADVWSPGEYFPQRTGLAPQTRQRSSRIDTMRIGDAERGLQFLSNAKQQELIPETNMYRVRFDFLNGPVQLLRGKSRTFELTWQALPAKPRHPLRRRIHIDDAVWTTNKAQPFQITPVYTEGWNRQWNYHNFWNRQVFKKEFIEQIKANVQRNWQRDKNAFCMYLNITTFDANTPEYRRYRYEWVGDDAEYVPASPETRTKKHTVMINSHTKSFLDFYMWHINKTIRYLSDDGKIPIHCYLDNSVSNRMYMMRLYRIVKSINPHNQIIAHMSGDSNVTAYAFADWLVEGEENTARYLNQRKSNPKLPKNYTRILTLDTVRARYSPYAFGEKFYLYQFWVWKKSAPARQHLWSLMAVHDGTTWAAGGPGDYKAAWKEFGWDQKVRFVPYWRKATGLRVDAKVKPVVVSGWTRGKRQLMALVVNDSQQLADVKLHVDHRKFGYSTSRLMTTFYPVGGLAYKKKPQAQRVTDVSKPLQFKLPAHSFQLIRFQQQ